MMAGEKTGVAMQIKTINRKCLYKHCYGHALNLAVADAIKSVPCISDSLDTVCEIGKLVKKSPQRNTKLDKTKNELLVVYMHFALRDGLCMLFWAQILQRKTTETRTIEDPKLPRKRKASVRHEGGERDTHHFPETPKHHYR